MVTVKKIEMILCCPTIAFRDWITQIDKSLNCKYIESDNKKLKELKLKAIKDQVQLTIFFKCSYFIMI